MSNNPLNFIAPKKYLGQNFLIDRNIRQKIISSCDLRQGDIILEIGPGKGVLTEEAAKYVKQIFAIEKDKRLADELSLQFKDTNVTIIHHDILKYPFNRLPENIKIIGNLPYNITTPIIEKIINNRHQFSSIYITVQLEYGQRITAKSGAKNYGSFSCFVQYYSDAKILFKIKNTAFFPSPKVQSCFMHLKFLKEPQFKAANEEMLFKIIRAAFQQRRKTIQNSLSTVLNKKELPKLLQSLAINPGLRAENLTLKDYTGISNVALKSRMQF